MNEKVEQLQKVINDLHERNELSKTITPNYFEPGKMEYLDCSEGIFDLSNGKFMIRFEVKGVRYEGRNELIEDVLLQDPITIIREKDNLFNRNNFYCQTKNGNNVGNLPANLCDALAPLFDEGKLTIENAFVSFVEPLSKRSRHAKQAVLFVEINGVVSIE